MTPPDGYDVDPVDLLFTEAELDMLFFTCLDAIGHPQTEEWTLSDEGFDTLLLALKKIQDQFDTRLVSGEPDVVIPQ